eukprot:CAMPEP_0175722430 /NCGR_PEP_ID=MMETSP0097-20121207/46223_1 /TAXON_ID=311494 /ORGANISM="Alexandrium monilatum, Strain CCMP3105" /LENGTH=50 /DNA_ID=CAMNT_0017030139 /DNA_START=48 /DNA_END=196 /DNA_ORIENTATION=+
MPLTTLFTTDIRRFTACVRTHDATGWEPLVHRGQNNGGEEERCPEGHGDG